MHTQQNRTLYLILLKQRESLQLAIDTLSAEPKKDRACKKALASLREKQQIVEREIKDYEREVAAV